MTYRRINISLIHISRHSQIRERIDVDSIRNLVGITDKENGGFTCGVLCPFEECGKIIGCIRTQYRRGNKKKKGGSDEEEMYRKPEWYFPNLKKHFLSHQEQLEPRTDNLLSFDCENEFSGPHVNTTEYCPEGDDSHNREHSDNSNGNKKSVNESRYDFSNMSLHFNTSYAAPASPLLSTKSQTTSRIPSVEHGNGSKVKSLISIFDGANQMQKDDSVLS